MSVEHTGPFEYKPQPQDWPQPTMPPEGTRLFETGATRGVEIDKLDYEGFISPRVLRIFAQYMHRCRFRNVPEGQQLRSSDNWQKGIPEDAYMKSLLRHVMEVWQMHRNAVYPAQQMEDALCAILFNVQGLLFEKSRPWFGDKDVPVPVK